MFILNIHQKSMICSKFDSAKNLDLSQILIQKSIDPAQSSPQKRGTYVTHHILELSYSLRKYILLTILLFDTTSKISLSCLQTFCSIPSSENLNFKRNPTFILPKFPSPSSSKYASARHFKSVLFLF